ncbi:NAD-dependent epimerase/dehydratase [Thermodesulfatator indicus DSM 15286]|uniref:NAD-dependent epimerase/dehydratase n=1 Tax=Thermodesulfatator indicus (strain DSM 15286 / JCM 11887 / CIR29812) TaxID=667014 RepID=F8A7Y5_THEID|nr:SDR family oxidoreductase [Thermodesulfatator indicus]AEH43901.1 NAD-dependent epimerase/dehydratase [Thermodesulfatator indicus DSM 15286]
MEFLITGGAGFIGSNIAEYLLCEGYKVRVLDNFSNGIPKNLAFVEEIPGAKARFTLIEGDIRDFKLCEEACKGVDYVFHEAALGSVPASVEDPATYQDVNATGTLNILRAASKTGVKRLVYAGSSSAYGDSEEETPAPKREDMLPNPMSPYAVTKLSGEYFCKIFPELYGLETVILRYFNVYGPRQDPKSQYAAVIPKFITALLKEETPTIFGDGEQTRDFIFVKDVVRANLLACKADKKAVGEVINIASGKAISINELYRIIAGIIDVDIKPNYAPSRAGDVRHSLADISKARHLLNLTDLTDLEEGLGKTIAWYKNYEKVKVS